MRQERITRTKRRRRRPVDEAPLVVRTRPMDTGRARRVLDRIDEVLEVA